MSLRFSPDEAVAMGIISKDDAQKMKQGGKRGTTPAQERLIKAKAASRPTATTAAAKVLAAANDPQTILYDALVKRLPAGSVQWEVPNLIKGRNFRADIVVGDCILVEMDGFAYHRSKDAFQKDRERQNLFAAEGYFVFRTFAKEVFDLARRDALVELVAGAYLKLHNGSN